jgi:hypothetical protein
MKRAIRRHHLRRMKAKARKVYPWCSVPQKHANHLAVCSCPGCGNPRRHFGERTRREQIDWHRNLDA